MTREQVKKLLPIMQAYAEGKTIQFLNRGKWYDVYDADFYQSPDVYRIKPEPKYRPFKTKEECWNEMLKHQPFGWVKGNISGEYKQVDRVFDYDAVLFFNISYNIHSDYYSDIMFDSYTFADGTPFGIQEE